MRALRFPSRGRLLFALLAGWTVLQTTVAAAPASWLTETNADGNITIVSGCTEGVLNVPATLDGRQVTGIGDEAFRGCRGLTEVVFPEGVRSVGQRAFEDCADLEILEFPVASAEGLEIQDRAFAGCSALTRVTLPWGLFWLGSSAFERCRRLTTVDLRPGPPGQSIYLDIGYRAFAYCASLSQINLPEGLYAVGSGAFNGCRRLTHVRFPDTVKFLGEGLFTGCESLASVHLGFSVASIEGLLSVGTSGFEITVDRLNNFFVVENGVLFDRRRTTVLEYPPARKGGYAIPAGVTRIGDEAFSGCPGLEWIDIPEGVTEIGAFAFAVCTGLTQVRLPRTLQGIGHSAFAACTGLENLELPPGVFEIGDAVFDGCTGLTHVVLPTKLQALGFWLFRGCSRLEDISWPSQLRRIGYGAFEGCTALGSVILPRPVSQVDDHAFAKCRGLTQVSLPDSLSALGWGVFVGCERLVDVKLPSHLPGIPDRTFEGCAALTGIHLPETLGGISNRAFADCVGLDTILIPRTVVHLAPDAFSGCRSLTEIRVDPENPIFVARDGYLTDRAGSALLIFPPGRTGDQVVPDGIRRVGPRAFASALSLTGVRLPEGLTDLAESAFYDCAALAQVQLPASLKTVGDSAFSGCVTLSEVVLPEGLTEIGGFAFSNCRGLTRVTIPGSVTNLGHYAFGGCLNLSILILQPGIRVIGASAFHGCERLTTVSLPHTLMSLEGGAFGGCRRLAAIEVEPGNPVYRSRDGVLFDAQGTGLVLYPPGKTGPYVIPPGVTALKSGAFGGCEGLTQLTLPASLTDLGDYLNFFPGCPNLEAFLVDPDHEVYRSLDGLLTDRAGTILLRCPAGRLGKVAIPEGIGWIEGGALDGCARITELVIPASLAGYSIPGGGETSGVQALGYTLSDWTSLQAIHVDDNNPVCRSLDGVLFDQSGRQIVRYPAGRSGAYRVIDGVREISNSAFAGSRNLTRIILPESVTRVGYGAFQLCPSLAAAFFEGDAPFSPCAMLPPAFVEPTLIYHLPEMGGFGEDEDWSTCLYSKWPWWMEDGTVTRLWTPEVAEGEGGLRLEDGSLAFTIFWARHREVVVESSPSLSPPEWTATATLTVGNDNFVLFRDPQPARTERRFYRLAGR